MTRALLFLELVLGVAAGIAAWSMHGEGGEARGAVLFAAVPLVGIAVLGTALVAARDGGGLTPSAGAVRLLACLAVGAALLQVVRFSPFVPATFFLLLHVAIATGAVVLLLRRGRRASFAWRAADVAAGALVILLVGGEVGVRIFAATSPGPLFVQRDMAPRDRIAAFRFRPGTIVDGTAANEQGFVGPPLARAADGRTVALVSDRALGGGLPYARGVAALATRPGLTVVHAALDGLSTPEYRALVDDVVLPIAPDAVIVVVDLGDDLAELDRDESAWRPLASWLDRDNVLTALTLARVSAALAERARLGQADGAQPAAIAATDDEIARDFPWIDDPLAEPARLSDERLAELERRALDANAGPAAARLADRATADLAAIAAACAAADVAFGVAVLPARYQIEKDLWSALRGGLPDGARDAPQHALRARLAARDIAFLDLTPALRAAQPWSDGRAHVFHRGDVRLNARGNRLCAEALAGFAARLLAGRGAALKTVVQRVVRAAVRVDGASVGAVEHGALLLVGVERGDTEADADATADKIAKLRFFPGATPMDRTLADVGGGCLVVSQFTLAGSVRKGNRPSFTDAEDPARAEALYLRVAARLAASGLTVATGRFGAKMAVELVNDGPVTLLVFVRDGRVL